MRGRIKRFFVPVHRYVRTSDSFDRITASSSSFRMTKTDERMNE